MLFHVFCILTHDLTTPITIPWGTLQISIFIKNENFFSNGVEYDFYSKYREELLIFARLNLQFQFYNITITVCNITIASVYHTEEAIYLQVELRPTYIPIHSPGLFFNQTDSAIIAFIYHITNGFRVAMNDYFVGGFIIRTDVRSRQVSYPGFDYSFTFKETGSNFKSLKCIIIMMKFEVEIDVNLHNSPMFVILPCTVEPLPIPPLNYECEYCMDKLANLQLVLADTNYDY